MGELLPSFLEAALVFALGVPLATLLAKAVLVLRWRRDPDVRRHGSLSAFLLVVAPSLATVLWVVSAALHESEAGGTSVHAAELSLAVHSLILASLLATVLASVLTYRWRRSGRHASRPSDAAAFARVARVCRATPGLASLRGRVRLVEGHAHAICTHGFLRPVVEVSTELARRLDDDALKAALLHEAAHRDALDPLRHLLASAALGLNPLGFLLRPELRRWRACREAICDREAVRRSADPLSLAEAIVAASRLGRPAGGFAVGLGEGRAALVRLRVHLLLQVAENPALAAEPTPRWLGPALVLGVILAPHVVSAWPLDGLHRAAEHLLATLGSI